jgi:hypothetical protein
MILVEIAHPAGAFLWRRWFPAAWPMRGSYVDWSADGRRVVFEGPEGMSWVDVQAPGQVHVIPPPGVTGNPSWSPHNRLLVITGFNGSWGLWTMRVDGAGLLVKIVDIADPSGRPDWGYPAGPVVALP